MSQTPAALQRRLRSAGSLEAVVRTMKVLAAASLGPYETALESLEPYARTVEAGFSVLLRRGPATKGQSPRRATDGAPGAGGPGEIAEGLTRPGRGGLGAIVVGSDLGMVGQFNQALAAFTRRHLGGVGPGRAPATGSPGRKPAPRAAMLERPHGSYLVGNLWVVGCQVFGELGNLPFRMIGPTQVPTSVESVPALMSQLLEDVEAARSQGQIASLRLIYNHPKPGPGFEPVAEHLLPLDPDWVAARSGRPWPGRAIPQPVGPPGRLLAALVREHLFVSLFRACARSGASEQLTRLALMQRAEKNIGDLREQLRHEVNQQRQAAIMDELFDILSGYETIGRTHSS